MYTVIKDGKTYEEHLDEIAAKTFDTDWETILQNVYPGSYFLNDSFPGLTGQALYDRIRPYQMAGNTKIFGAKLAWSDIQTAVAEYKAALEDKLTLEFDYLQRSHDFSERINNLPHFRSAADALGMFSDFGNMAILKEKIISENLEDELSQIESKHAELVLEIELQKNVDLIQEKIAVGNRIISTIAYLNTQNNITPEQLQNIYSNQTILGIITLLQTGALGSAKYQIQNLDLSNLAPMDESYRTRIISMIDEVL